LKKVSCLLKKPLSSIFALVSSSVEKNTCLKESLSSRKKYFCMEKFHFQLKSSIYSKKISFESKKVFLLKKFHFQLKKIYAHLKGSVKLKKSFSSVKFHFELNFQLKKFRACFKGPLLSWKIIFAWKRFIFNGKKSMFTTSKGSLLSGKSNLLKKVSSSVEKIPCLL